MSDTQHVHVRPDRAGVYTPKSRTQAIDTCRVRFHANRGFLTSAPSLVLSLLAIFCLFLAPLVFIAISVILLADFVYFFAYRLRTISTWERLPRLTAIAEWSAVSDAYAKSGIAEPTMTDFEEVSGLSGHATWRNDLRYEEIVHCYRGGTVLDFGAGDGRLLYRYKICSPVNYIAADVSRDLLIKCSQIDPDVRTVLLSQDDEINLGSESVDFIACTEALEHVTKPAQIVREFSRVLRTGGRVVIQSPCATRLRNPNPFHLLQILFGYYYPKILLPTVV